jgi:cold shock CspA family protein
MHGTITSFSGKGSCGAIRSDDGGCFDFGVAAVLAYDVASLTAGQLVNFESDSGSPPKAVNVSVRQAATIHFSEDTYRDIRRPRYMGFDQQGSVRTYRFERFTPGKQTEHFSLGADVGLLSRHKVRLQEGPVMCLHLLTSALGAMNLGEACPCLVTEEHMLAFLASRPDPSAKSGLRNRRRAS